MSNPKRRRRLKAQSKADARYPVRISHVAAQAILQGAPRDTVVTPTR